MSWPNLPARNAPAKSVRANAWMKPHDQLEQQLELLPPKGPKVLDSDVAKMLQILAGNGWLTSGQIQALTEWQERYVRAVANASRGRVLSYPGSPGYKLTREATKAEVDAADILGHQANEMRRRLVEIRNVFYGRRAA